MGSMIMNNLCCTPKLVGQTTELRFTFSSLGSQENSSDDCHISRYRISRLVVVFR